MQHLSFQDEIAKNKRNSILLVISVSAVLFALFYILAYILSPSSMFVIIPLSFVFIIIYIYSTYEYGDRVVLSATHAKPAEGRDYQYLIDTVISAFSRLSMSS